jgi:hypothetical protein
MDYLFFVIWIFLMVFALGKVVSAYYDFQEKLKALETKSL